MLKIEAYSEKHINDAIAIWNDIVEDGIAFPQKEMLDPQTGDAFFKSQSFTGIAIDADSGEVSDELAERFAIATRPGAHCAPRLHRALGTEDQGAVRFSWSYFNTKAETDAAAEAVRILAEE